jgi:hypothetical protein
MKANHPPIVAVVIAVELLLALLFTTAEAREFTSSTGQKLEAEIIYVVGQSVTIEKADKTRVSIPIKRFSAADRKYIADWQEKNRATVPDHLKDKTPRMVFTVSNGKTNRDDDRRSGYVDEHRQNVCITVTMENKDAVYPVVGSKLTVMVLGTDPETKRNAVVYRQEFEKIDLPLNQEQVAQARSFELWYDDRGAMYGHKYKGYIVFLEDGTGKVLAEACIPGTAAKRLDNARKLKVGDIYDRMYNKLGTTSVKESVQNLK